MAAEVEEATVSNSETSSPENRNPENRDSETGEPEIRVTDKRMFTADGQLREEYRFLEDRLARRSEAEPEPPSPPRAGDAPPAMEPPPARPGEPAAAQGAPGPPPLELPTTPPGLGAPTFLDLVGMLAEPVAVYLGDAPLPGGRSGEDLDMARLHIDLLALLREKTAGNLTRQEAAILEDVLYRLQMRYVQKRG